MRHEGRTTESTRAGHGKTVVTIDSGSLRCRQYGIRLMHFAGELDVASTAFQEPGMT
jgi:hypothetical protein